MQISEIISIPIIPVILMPVTGLVSLCFYNRLAVINQRVRFLQKELRELLQTQKHVKELVPILQREMGITQRRSRLITISLIFCLLAVAAFSITAVFVAMGLYFTWAPFVALTFWFVGPVLILIGIINGIAEHLLSGHALKEQSDLIERWGMSEGEKFDV